MAAKRCLYQPAPSTRKSIRTRKPLTMGRLVTDSDLLRFNNQDEPPEDPTILPANSLPVLTEDSTPQPEPLQCLDLSDSDTDIHYSFGSCSNWPKPVMVFDASQQKELAHGAELDVQIGFEKSPARVVCHMSGKLEQSLLEERRRKQALGYSGGDGPGVSVKVDRIQNVTDFENLNEKSSHLLDERSAEKTKSERNSSRESSDNDIHQDNGILKDILLQDLGNSNLEAISLQSDSIELSPQLVTNTIHASGKSQHSSENNRHEGLPSLSQWDNPGSPVFSGFTQSKQEMRAKSRISFPQPKFDDVSVTSPDLVPIKKTALNEQPSEGNDFSGSEACSLYEYVPVNKPREKQADHHRMVTTFTKDLKDGDKIESPQLVKKKGQRRKISSRYMQSSLNKASVLLSKNTSTNLSQSRPNLRTQSATQVPSKHSRDKLQVTTNSAVTSKKSALGKPLRNTNALSMKASNSRTQPQVIIPTEQTFIRSDSQQEVLKPSESSSKDQKTSTPTHDQVCHLSQDINASVIKSISTLSMNMSLASIPRYKSSILDSMDSSHKEPVPERLFNIPPADCVTGGGRQYNKENDITLTDFVAGDKPQRNKKNVMPPTDCLSGGRPQGKSQLQLDLQYSRYVQMAFLACKAKKAYEEQDKAAQAQVHALWKLVESARKRKIQLELEVSRLDTMIEQDNLLNKIEADLDIVLPVVSELETPYSQLCSQADMIRHQLSIKDVYVPPAGAEERELYEDQLKTNLTESELIMNEIDELSSRKSESINQCLHSVEGIDKTIITMHQTLQETHNDMVKMKDLTTHLTSLYFGSKEVKNN